LLRALLARLTDQGVVFKPRHAFVGFGQGRTLKLRDAFGATLEITPDAAVFALGGASWPRLGTDGGWTRAFGEAGIAVTPLATANCALHLAWSPHFLEAFEGQPLKSLQVFHGDKAARGDLVVTRRGLEGGPAYALASGVRESFATGDAATLSVDLRPDQSVEVLAAKLGRPRGKASLATHLRKTLALSKIDIALLREALPEGLPQDPQALAACVKAAPLKVGGVAGFERAISTAGGVAFDALDADLMLKVRPGIFVAGEMLDFDAPTGGYLLQAAFSTGAAAAQGAARGGGDGFVVDHDLADALRKLFDRRGIYDAAQAAPDDRSHAHRAGLAGRVDRRALHLLRRMECAEGADRHHLAMRGRIVEALAAVAPCGEHAAVLRDYGAEGKVALRGLGQRQAHEALVLSLLGLEHRAREGRTRGEH